MDAKNNENNMETNNKTINHLFSYILDDLFWKKIYFIFQSSEDITSKKVKSILKKYDGFIDWVPSSDLRFEGLLTEEKCKEYQNSEYPVVQTLDFTEFQNVVSGKWI